MCARSTSFQERNSAPTALPCSAGRYIGTATNCLFTGEMIIGSMQEMIYDKCIPGMNGAGGAIS